MKRPPIISPASYLTEREIQEQRNRGEQPHAVMHVAVAHGATTRVIEIPLKVSDLLVIAANAADAARLLSQHGDLNQ